VVPDHRARLETDLETVFEQAPADVDIISSRSELRIKAAHGHEAVLSE